MIYKAVMNKNRYTISHAVGGVTYDWQKKAHSTANGQYVSKTNFDNYYADPNNYYTTGGSTSTKSGPKYTREDPDTLTTEQLVERNRWYTQYNNYNKNFGSTQKDIEDAVENTKALLKNAETFINKIPTKTKTTKLDLSGMSDKELSDYISRAQLESQYNSYYNPPKKDNTKEWISLAIAGAGVLVSAAGVATPYIVKAIRAKKKGGK